ncbi:MAG: tRNA preQ1(34) S-adenosylmethionine ribosyltransferase-isomerase QueA [Patescibacteria group bacterium]|nr:tRNA preQ1(34) S-adenosylmethionine ribosyltransferase-isomerase QueA [Patescibacteria group bacterium]
MQAIHPGKFDYALPPDCIAQQPITNRAACRLMVVDRIQRTIRHCRFSDLPDLLTPGDLLVANDTKVIPARLFGKRQTGGKIEALLVRPLGGRRWEALLKPWAKIHPGETLAFAPGFSVKILDKTVSGLVTIKFLGMRSVERALSRFGHVPLPPYIRRPDRAADRKNYQTVFAKNPGAVAAPTAGLHFTPRLLAELRRRGVTRTAVTLHVGLGTFQPLRAEQLASGRLHAEHYRIPADAAQAIKKTQQHGGRIVAVGTTVVRTLEHAARRAGRVRTGAGETTLFITPGFRFRAVDALVTNFHLPQSSLLMLVCAFGGTDLILRAYREAISKKYRFYSYGDAMLVV